MKFFTLTGALWLACLPYLSSSVHAQATLPFSEDFERGAVDTSIWRLRPNLEGENGIVEVVLGAPWFSEGQFGLRLGKSRNGGLTLNGAGIRVDLANKRDVILSFDIIDNYDELHPQDGIYIKSGSDTGFTRIWEFDFAATCNRVYNTHPALNISLLAEENGITLDENTVVEFRQYDDADFDTNVTGTEDRDGYAIDDISMYEANYTYLSPPLTADFEDGQLPLFMAVRTADNTVFPLTSLVRPSSLVEVNNTFGRDGTFGLQLGKRCDEGTNSVSTADVNVDLSSTTNVLLDFWIYDYLDKDNLQDGIYLSVDGAATFTRIWQFEPESWCSQYNRHPPINITRLAQAAGLILTDRSVIRFQQFGDSDFNTNFTGTNDRDGFSIDDIRIYDRPVMYANLPFIETFDDVEELSTNFAYATDGLSLFPLEGLIRPSNRVAIDATLGVEGTPGVVLGKSCDETNLFSASMLDLHLNLDPTMHDSVNLSFYLADHREERHQQDALYLSVDGGASFERIHQFDFTQSPDFQFEKYVFSISALAATINLNLSDQTIVRFQQYDDADFNTNFTGTNDRDGIVLDSIIVSSMRLTNTDNPAANTLSVQLAPNPAHDQLTVTFGGHTPASTPTSYLVHDVAGRRMIRRDIPRGTAQLSIDLQDLSPGIYFLSFPTRGGGVVTRKLIVR